MKRFSVFFLLLCLIGLTLMSIPPANPEVQETKNGNITFQPNNIPNLTITDRPPDKPESFRFEWLGNKLDLELFFNATYKNKTRLFSLRDFEDDFNVSVTYLINKTESLIQFGWIIDNVESVNDLVHNAWFKIEDTQPFDYEDIKLEVIEIPEAPFNITRFKLPDNLVLSFEDLYHKGFIIGHQNKTSIGFEGFKNKTQWNLDPITFSSDIITAIIETGKGDSWVNAYDYWDLWNASNVNGWDVVHNNNNTNRQFEFNAKIQIGNGTLAGETYFSDTNVQILINDIDTVSYERIIVVTAHSNFRMGTLIDVDDKSTKEGVQFISLLDHTTPAWHQPPFFISTQWASTGEVYFYSCSFVGVVTQLALDVRQGTVRVWGCHFNNGLMGEGNNVFGTYVSDSGGYVFSYARGSIIENVDVFNCYALVYTHGAYTFELKNVYSRGNTYLARIAGTWSGSGNVINGDIDNWLFTFGVGATGKVYRQYEFDLTVTYPNGTTINGTETGARVTIQHYGNNSGVDYNGTLNGDGSINQTILNMGFYNQTGGDTIYNYNPYSLQIYNASGYLAYSKNFTLNEKTEWEVALIDESQAGYGGFVFLFFGLVVGFVVGALVGFGSKRK